jgi:hypothetical protein
MATSTARSATVVKPPPRYTGDPQVDGKALFDWMWEFFQATVVQSGLLDPKYQSTAGTFDSDNLPDPADTSIARAQDTANHAIEALKAHGLYP